MINKKAWVRILEAFIAIILIMSVFIILYSRTVSKTGMSEQIYRFEESILDEVASKEEFRNIILTNGDITNIKTFISQRMLPGFDFDIRICNVEEICELETYIGKEGEEIYSNERIISSTIAQQTPFQPKKIKIFMWEK